MNKIENATRGITNMITNPVYMSYGLLGLSSVILGYYTLFDNKIDEVVQEPVQQSTVQQSIFQEPMVQEPIVQEPIVQEEEPQQEQPSLFQGGKKKKYTRTNKKRNKSRKH